MRPFCFVSIFNLYPFNDRINYKRETGCEI